jgi:hypothetical protein
MPRMRTEQMAIGIIHQLPALNHSHMSFLQVATGRVFRR